MSYGDSSSHLHLQRRILPNESFTTVPVRPSVQQLVTDLVRGNPNWDWRRVHTQVQIHFPDASRDEVRSALAVRS